MRGQRYLYWLLGALMLLAVLSGLPGGSYAAVAAPALQGASHTFPETGYTVRGRFLQYWQEGGGLEQFGYPISAEMGELSPVDGTVYTVQYFERALFEYHPEHQPPHDVLLALLGSFTYKQRYPYGASPQIAANTVGAAYFAETGRYLCCEFLTYWQAHGGLAQQGYPITDILAETSQLDGNRYLVQYFERAVYELHEDGVVRPDYVLLSQLGTFRYQQFYPGRSALYAPPAAVPPALPRAAPTPTARPKPKPAPTATSKPYVPPTARPPSGGRCGAICRDGTRSSATGSGACSHHGGVDHWLYCDVSP